MLMRLWKVEMYNEIRDLSQPDDMIFSIIS